MSKLLFYSQFNVDSPEACRVILIPMETTLFSSENRTPTLKSSNFWGKGPYTLEIKLGPLFQGLYPKYSNLGMGIKSLFFRKTNKNLYYDKHLGA